MRTFQELGTKIHIQGARSHTSKPAGLMHTLLRDVDVLAIFQLTITCTPLRQSRTGPTSLQVLSSAKDTSVPSAANMISRSPSSFVIKFFEARWEETDQAWKLGIQNLTSGQSFDDTRDIFIYACGHLNHWVWPEISGLDEYEGDLVHRANWVRTYSKQNIPSSGSFREPNHRFREQKSSSYPSSYLRIRSLAFKEEC